MKRTLIGISGAKGVGKDTSAAVLLRKYGFIKMSFAQPLKDAAAYAFQSHVYIFDDPDYKDRMLPSPFVFDENTSARFHHALSLDKNVFNGTKKFDTPREALQYLGTDLIREHYGANFWCKELERRLPSIGRVVIPDARFANERQLIRDNGGILILVKRPNVATSEHSSEQNLGADSDYDLVVDNVGSVAELENLIETWYKNRDPLRKLGL